MLIPTVTELPRRLEPVTRDDFADDGQSLRAADAAAAARTTRSLRAV